MLPLTVLQDYDNSHVANKTLERCYKYVLPLVEQKNLLIHISEFYPKNQNLLGMNKGTKLRTVYNSNIATIKRVHDIYVRLRFAKNKNSFISDHDLIGTILHEIIHCYIGPHNDKFYKMLDEFWIEVQMMNPKYKKSATSSGHVLGGTNRPLNNRLLIAGTTNQQQNVGNILGGSNKPLNNRTLMNAALSRLQEKDRRTCGTVIDLTTEDSPIAQVIDLTHL